MASPRRRPTRDDGIQRWLRRVVQLVAIGLLLGMAVSSSAFSLMNAGRGGAVDVANDPSGPLGLTVYTCVDKDTIDPLVDVEN